MKIQLLTYPKASTNVMDNIIASTLLNMISKKFGRA